MLTAVAAEAGRLYGRKQLRQKLLPLTLMKALPSISTRSCGGGRACMAVKASVCKRRTNHAAQVCGGTCSRAAHLTATKRAESVVHRPEFFTVGHLAQPAWQQSGAD